MAFAHVRILSQRSISGNYPNETRVLVLGWGLFLFSLEQSGNGYLLVDYNMRWLGVGCISLDIKKKGKYSLKEEVDLDYCFVLQPFNFFISLLHINTKGWKSPDTIKCKIRTRGGWVDEREGTAISFYLCLPLYIPKCPCCPAGL